jgi:hypothetical protein
MPRGEGNQVMAAGPDGQPYLMSVKAVPAGEGFDPVTVNFELKRGLWVTGKVTDKVTGQPLRAHVEYFVFEDNPHRREAPGLAIDIYLNTRADDGSYRLAALPGRGMIAVRGYDDRFLSAVNADKIKGLRPDGHFFATRPHLCDPLGYHTLVEITPEKGAAAITCDVALDPGRTVRGTVLGPDGKPLAGAKPKGLRSYVKSGYWEHEALKTAEFTATGLVPGQKRRLFFLHQEQKLAGSVVVSGDDKEPVTARLAPWGEVTGRVVDEAGQPRPGLTLLPRGFSGDDDLALGTVPEWPRPTTDTDGRFRIVGLVPGLKYSVSVLEEGYRLTGDVFRELTIKSPGEVRALGDVKARRGE